ncbi:hypothetical protein AVEN_47635-1 [Araneus ventricosus]|uniref:Uncharacterized protein n=1 Tax=Araneus ventricosus TaxID=182803 RepID=A0A4Y2KNL2_ARAVE|nr:hypothetical protein AVEN_47635-1 [Araneus ventricosus]
MRGQLSSPLVAQPMSHRWYMAAVKGNCHEDRSEKWLTFLVVKPDYGKVLEFSPPPAYSGMTPKGIANVFADSDGFLGIVSALCVKSFLSRPPRYRCPSATVLLFTTNIKRDGTLFLM